MLTHMCIHIFNLDPTYKRKHVTFVFLNLFYFSSHDVLQFHPCPCKCHNFILYVLRKLLVDIHTCHVFFMHSSVYGHLG